MTSKYKGKCKECKYRDVVDKKWWGCTTVVCTFNSQMGKALPASENIPAWCPTGGVPEKREVIPPKCEPTYRPRGDGEMSNTETTKPMGTRYEYRDLRFDEFADLFEVLSRLPQLSEKDRERLKKGVENIRKMAVIRM